MVAKRNKNKEVEEVKDEQVQAQAESLEETQAEAELTSTPHDDPINADEMAAAVKTTGSAYQQYARQMFKDRLEASR